MDGITLWTFLLVLVRISAFMVSAPLFSVKQIPARYKIGLSVLLSILCAGVIKEPLQEMPDPIILFILKEAMAGIALGFVASIFLYAVRVAGTFIDFQVGFFMGNMFDPTFGTNTMLTGQLKNVLAVLVLLATNGHHLLIQGVLASFDWIALHALIPAWMDGRMSTFLPKCIAEMFMLGFMIALPIIGTLFVVDVGLGIVAKTVPQMNLFAVFPPIKILIHFLIYIFILPSFFYLLRVLFESMFEAMMMMMRIMGA